METSAFAKKKWNGDLRQYQHQATQYPVSTLKIAKISIQLSEISLGYGGA